MADVFEKINDMKNWILITISVVAMALAIVSIAIVAPSRELDFDYYGAIIGVLSFLVTLLMGYQIYTVINVKKDMDEVRRIRTELDKKLGDKAEELTTTFREELKQAAPVIMAISSTKSDIIIGEVFRAYYKARPGQLAKELSEQAILTILGGFSIMDDEAKRKKKIEELASVVKYDEIIEFYTDYAKSEHQDLPKEIEPFILELIDAITKQKDDGTKE